MIDDEPGSQWITCPNSLPPILTGRETDVVRARVERFYLSIAEIYERWLARRSSPHTRRAYRQDVESLLRFLAVRWPEESTRLLGVSVAEVQAWRDALAAEGLAPKTLNRRVSSVSSLYRYFQAAAAELRLPIVVPNPAHAQFIRAIPSARRSPSATRVRQLMGLPEGESLVAYRDRALLKWHAYSCVRMNTSRLLDVADVHVDGDETTVGIREKGAGAAGPAADDRPGTEIVRNTHEPFPALDHLPEPPRCIHHSPRSRCSHS